MRPLPLGPRSTVTVPSRFFRQLIVSHENERFGEGDH
mgnify:CR=1 FL=1